VITDALADSVPVLLQRAYGVLMEEDLAQANELLEKALSIDFEHPEVVYALKCVNFWTERAGRAAELQPGFEKGEYLLSQWKSFQAFLARFGSAYERCVYAVRQFVFSEALASYQGMMTDSENQQDPELLVRMGKCYKGKGDYIPAVKFFEAAAQNRREDAETLAELGDCYALINETRSAKALLREAFFVNARKVEIDSLESEMMRRLVSKLRELGLASPELEEWLPVYAVLFGVFTVKRELRPIEIGKLKQSIYQLEKEQKEDGADAQYLVPRLINRYFWLIDHYIAVREEKPKIDEVLLKIKLLDASVHRQYVS
jgi:tetratricopeptide (TPR) repeat protein